MLNKTMAEITTSEKPWLNQSLEEMLWVNGSLKKELLEESIFGELLHHSCFLDLVIQGTFLFSFDSMCLFVNSETYNGFRKKNSNFLEWYERTLCY